MAAPAHIARENGKKGGRPIASHTIEASVARARMVEKVGERIDDIVKWLFQKAYQVDDKGNETIDVAAIKELLDRAYGRPSQAVDITSKGESIAVSDPRALALAQKYEEELRKGLK